MKVELVLEGKMVEGGSVVIGGWVRDGGKRSILD